MISPFNNEAMSLSFVSVGDSNFSFPKYMADGKEMMPIHAMKVPNGIKAWSDKEKTSIEDPVINNVPARIKMIREKINTTFLVLMLS
jgi:hypothetical protein